MTMFTEGVGAPAEVESAPPKWTSYASTERRWRPIPQVKPLANHPEPESAELLQADTERAFLASIANGRALKLDRILGQPGGQGSVYSLANHAGLVYKRYRHDLHGAAHSFGELVLDGRSIVPDLEQIGINAVWPLVWCGSDDLVEGYVMPRIPDHFKATVRGPYGEVRKESTLDLALDVKVGSPFEPVRPLASIERLQLVRLVGVFLDTLHTRNLVYGDLSLKNMMFALDPVRLLVMDLDGVHRISTPLVPAKDILHTPDWNDPHAPGQVPHGFDLDRYRYSLMVYRMLVANHVSAPFPSDPASLVVPSIDGVDEVQRATLEFLLRRAAASGCGGRPPISEWLGALEHA